MDDLFLYALHIANTDVNMQPPIAVSVDAPQSLAASAVGYSPNPFNVKALLKNISEETVNNVQVKIVLPNGLKLSDGSSETIEIGVMDSNAESNVIWKVKASSVNAEKTYTYKIIVTAENGYEKIVTKRLSVPEIKQTEKMFEYTVFSANQNEDLTLNGWKSNFTGGIYSGRNFVCNLSEFYLDGKVDAAGTVTANGWKINIPEKNENIEAIAMPDLEEAILAKAGEYTYYAESPSYIQDTNIINGSIMVSGDVTISGTNFEGDCYIIADKDITYNVNNLNTTGRLVLYSRNGNITVNGTNISIDGIMYAPKGKVSFNANETTVNGHIWGDTVNFSGSVFNIKGSDSDLDLIGETAQRGITKTYTASEDFSEGTLDGVSLAVPDQLILAENAGGDKNPIQKVYGDSQSGNGIKITYSADTSAISQNGEAVNISYGLSGFGEIQNDGNAVDLVILVDESGSMNGSRMTNAKASAKQVVSQMKLGDRCAVVGFSTIIHDVQAFTSDKDELYSAIDELKYTGGTNIGSGLKYAVNLFESNERQKYIMLISDGEDSSASAAMATTAGEKGIRILAMMVGTGSLQMQTVAINSNGIYKNAPTAEEIGKIMTYFASEVFNTAGRNTTFKATVKDKNSVDLSAVTPAPASITEHSDGSITLEWFFDRISIDETETINLPITANADGEFAELITDISCVYYDKNGKPGVIYADDAAIPVSKYASSGSWTAVFDSEQANTEWSGIFWNGIRYGDGNISVTASVSEDGVTFGEAVPVRNYAPLSGLTGRYIKLNVDMTASSDGQTPELFDITVTAENVPETDNSEPNASIYAKLGTKVNVPVTVRGIVSDDCLADDLSFEWSCTDGNVIFADKNALITSAVFCSEGEYEIKLTVNDGEKTAVDLFGITVSPADKYEDIDPESGEASAPEISVKLPQYADRYQKISAEIENLNNTEISWYSVIFNDRTAVEVSDSGEFTLTMPGSNGTYKVVVRAFDWSGKSDVKEYTIIVNSETPTIEILPSAEKIFTGEEAYFTVNTTLADKIKTVEYTLNGEAVSISDGKYTLDTANAGTYTLTAKAVTNSNKTITASASIEVIKASTPIVDLVFDKELYSEGDDVIVTVVAEDENGIAGIALEYNYQQVQLDENNSFRIENITAGEHTLVGIAWNAAGIVSSAGYSITIEPAKEAIITIEALVDDTEIYLGETARLTVNVNGGDGTERVSVDVNGNALTSENNVYEYIPGAVGEYVFNVTVETASGNSKTVSVTVNVTEPYTPPEQDVSAPSVDLSLNKDIYYEGDDIIITVKADDNIGVTNIVLTVNGEELSADENGRFIIENAEVGTYDIKATAYDAAGNSAWTSVSVPVNNKGSEPADKLTLEVDIDTSKVKVGEPFDINITTDGGVGEKIISCTVNNESVAVENSKASYTPEQFGTYDIAVSAVDEAGSNITKAITLTINESGADIGGGSEEKIVTVSLIINDDRINDGTHNEAKVGDEVSVYVEIKNLSDDEIESLVVTVNGEEIVLDSDKKAVYIPEKADEYLFNAILTAKDGNVSDLKYMLYVTENGGGENPDDPDDDELFVDITSPEDVKEITAPTDIIGSAKGSGLVKYTLEYAPAGTDEFTAICEDTEAIDGSVIGQLAPTMLRNGYYDIRLTGYTSKAHKSDVITVYVTGQMKIGNFSIAFQDMDVNV
ncbi:MAG: VWA domain-containing protein, partial [Oscillospiraceae bacterium]|nr:VWA domain-containing protein [Oscillospiraceae bacterium]